MVRKGADLILLDPPSTICTCAICHHSPTTLLALVWGESSEIGRCLIEACYFCPEHLNEAQQTFVALREKYRA
jgi:hypothetical protein